MKLSTKGRYATRILLCISRLQGDLPVPKKRISEQEGISTDYIEQIIVPLKNSRLGEQCSRSSRRIPAGKRSSGDHGIRHTGGVGGGISIWSAVLLKGVVVRIAVWCSGSGRVPATSFVIISRRSR